MMPTRARIATFETAARRAGALAWSGRGLGRLRCCLLCLFALCAAPQARAEYRLSTGDVVEVSVLSLPTFRQEATVGIDGEITVPLLGDVPARGLSLSELRQKLQSALPAKAVRQRGIDGRGSIAVIDASEIGVRIARYKPVYLSGDVTKPGAQPFQPGMTIRQAIALAGGYNLLRFKMDNPVIETANLRAEYEAVWANITKEAANVWRLRSLVATLSGDKPPAKPARLSDEPEPARSAVGPSAQELAEQQLRLQVSDAEKEKGHLKRALAKARVQLTSLTDQQSKEREGVTADAAEYDQVSALFQRGAVIATRLADSRRSLLLSSTRALQTTVQVSLLEREQGELDRRMERIDDQRRLEALEKLQTAETDLTALHARLRGISGKLVYTGALRSQLMNGSGTVPDIAVFRGSDAEPLRPAAAEDIELQPGDVVEVTVRPDLGLRGAGDATGQN